MKKIAIIIGSDSAQHCVDILPVTDGELAQKLNDKRKADHDKVTEKNKAAEDRFNI